MSDPADDHNNLAQAEPGRVRPWAPWLLAAVVTVIMLFPAGMRAGVWGAPLESGPGLVLIAGVWLMAWVASALGIPRRHLKIVWWLVAAMACYKALLLGIMGVGGVEARVEPAEGALVTSQIASPLRPRGPNGWPLYRTTAVPPYFINDIRRFDYYGAEKARRGEVPYVLEMRGYANLGKHSHLAPGPSLTLDEITTSAAPGGAGFHLKASGVSGDPVRSALGQARDGKQDRIHPLVYLLPAAPESAPGWWTLQGAGSPESPPVHWILYFGFAYLASLLAGRAGVEFGRRFWFGLGVVVAALLVPTHFPIYILRWWKPVPVHWVLLCTSAVLFAGAGWILWLRRRSLDLAHHRAWHALLVFAWCILAVRFFLDRYPGGFAVLAGGSDSLFHYTFASEIIRGDWLHRADAPFSRQFFMRYIIAAVMTLVGEGPVWAMMVNAFAYGVIGLQIASVVRTCGGRFWMLMPPLWLAFAFVSPFKMWIPTLFPEIMSIVFLMAAVDQLCKWHAGGRVGRGRIVGAAIWLGVAIYTRNNYIISAPLLLGLVWYNPECAAGQRGRWRWRPVALFAAILVVMVGIVGVRNTLLAPAGEPFTLLLSQKIKAAALYQGFLPGFIGDPDLVRRYGALPLDQQFIHALQERPLLYLRYVLDRIIVLFGGPATVEPNLTAQYPKFSPVHLLLFGGAGLQALMYGLRRRRMSFAQLLCWSLILPQVALVVFMIGYVGEGYRFLLPCYPLLIILLLSGRGEYWRRGDC